MDRREVLADWNDDALITSAAFRLCDLMRGDNVFNQLVAEVTERRTGLNPWQVENHESMTASLDVTLEAFARLGMELSNTLDENFPQ